MASVAQPSLAPGTPGVWVKWRHSKHRNRTTWHWFHKQDSTSYCGSPRPQGAQTSRWEPVAPCQKCMTRILREGY